MSRMNHAKLLASTDRIGLVSSDIRQAFLTFSTDTAAYASGDLIADTQEITGFFPGVSSVVEILQYTLIDSADQKAVIFPVFMLTATSLGTENGAPNISDANLLLGFPQQFGLVAADYVDFGGAAVATKRLTPGLIIKGAGASTSIWHGIINETGTPDYDADSLKAQILYRVHSV